MGDLYRAVDDELARPVAIKVLAPRFATDETVRRRFRREALAAARLSDAPSTVTTYDVGEWNGTPYLVMEYLAGGTVEQALRRGAQPTERALLWLTEAASALDAAHTRGVVHRDVKPANLLLDGEGHVHVGDFGIATAAGLDALTVTGTVLGTAGYLAPEQALARPASAASDEYGLAVVAYELLTGTRPFERDSYADEANAHVNEQVPPASRRNSRLHASVDRVFARALAKEPAHRFPTCAAFVAELRACVEPSSAATRVSTTAPTAERATHVTARLRRRSIAAVAAVLVLLAGAALAAGVALRGGSAPGARRAATPPAPVHSVAHTSAKPAKHHASLPPADREQSGSDLNTRGYELMLAGNYPAALTLLMQAVTRLMDPSNPVTAYANFNLGQTLVRLGRCSSALPYLHRAAQLEPWRPEPSNAIAVAERCAGQSAASLDGGAPSSGHGNDHARGHWRHGGGGQDQQD
jgi:serine/threonine kinase PknH